MRGKQIKQRFGFHDRGPDRAFPSLGCTLREKPNLVNYAMEDCYVLPRVAAGTREPLSQAHSWKSHYPGKIPLEL